MVMAVQAPQGFWRLHSRKPNSQLHPPQFLPPQPATSSRRKALDFSCTATGNDDYYLIDAEESAGDGFSFSGGKYSGEPSPSDEWFKRGKMVKAHPVFGSKEKAQDPIFGLKMGSASQTSDDLFRWFCVESGSADSPTVVLVHGFPSQAYSYRKVLPVLSKNYHPVAFDWLGFGFSDKPQPKYGFDYTLDEYASSLESLINEIGPSKISLVAQGYSAPVAVKYASSHQDKISSLILLNPPVRIRTPVGFRGLQNLLLILDAEELRLLLHDSYPKLTAAHANLPSTLSIFSNFLLGEIFSQDPLRASDKVLTSSGPYKMKEDDAMVYRSPYLTSGSAGFALNAISRAMKKDLKKYVEEAKEMLLDKSWGVQTTVCWGRRDRWLSFDGVEELLKGSKVKLIELPMVSN
ncbi:unnamed protein product [Linum tenue]|uniref:AB hydrolase-1 domain-containing protein n=1 Tax=Linum tenue TaxID=586396 RepID=A0AAV0NLP7_9ROSI|nr:unnamed protein product [Linum tenue]